jgi:hypothetical protein
MDQQNYKWTIQITYTANKEDGKNFQARTVFWTEAPNVGSAYKKAEKSFKGRDVKFGAIIHGHHQRMP